LDVSSNDGVRNFTSFQLRGELLNFLRIQQKVGQISTLGILTSHAHFQIGNLTAAGTRHWIIAVMVNVLGRWIDHSGAIEKIPIREFLRQGGICGIRFDAIKVAFGGRGLRGGIYRLYLAFIAAD
jgi:hypothetical protein